MNSHERQLVARAALLNVESEVYVASYNERVERFMRDCPPELLDQLGRDFPEECAEIARAVPTAAQLIGLDNIINQLRHFTDMPSEDRGYVASCFMQLHEARELMLRGFFIRAQQEADETATRLHWLAKERKRNAVRAAHRMPDPEALEKLDKLSNSVSIWAHRLTKPSKVVAS